MPLVTKKAPSQVKGSASSTSATSVKTVPKKAASKSVTVIKGKVPAKKAEKKAPKAKAGYELYSDDGEHLRHELEAYGSYGHVRTLIQDYQSADEKSSGADMNYTVEKHLPGSLDRTTAFNKRLVSSTPDPERLLDSEDLRPHSEDQVGTDAGVDTAQREENAAAMLSDSEREHVRQQLDAALIEEATAQNMQLHQQMKDLVTAQKQQAKSGMASSFHPAPKRKGILPASMVSQRPHGVPVTRPLVKKDETGMSSHHSYDEKTVITNVGTCAQSQQLVGVSKEPVSSSLTSYTRKTDTPLNQGSDTDAFRKFLDTNHNRGSNNKIRHFIQRKHSGDNAELLSSQNMVSNVSTGFTPRGSAAAPVNQLYPRIPEYTCVAVPRPLSVATGEETSVHSATPACSPVRISEKLSVPVLGSASGTSASTQVPIQHAPGEKWDSGEPKATGSATQGLVHLTFGLTGSGEAGQHVNHSGYSDVSGSSIKQPGNKLPSSDSKMNAETDHYTWDGYYINQAVVDGKKDEDDSTPRSQLPLPTAMHLTNQASGEGHQKGPSAQSNKNNSNLQCMGQLYTNPNMCWNTMNLARQLHGYAQTQSQTESMAGLRTPGLLTGQISSEVQMEEAQVESMKLNTNKVSPEYTSQGPLQLRAVVAQLKQYTDGHGDGNIRHLVQRLIDTVEWLPQLKKDFSLDEYRKCFQIDAVRQRRRVKNLNVLLRQMEKKNMVDRLRPDALIETLHLETEKIQLAARLRELEENYCQLQEEKSMLMAKLADMEQNYRKCCEALIQNEQQLQLRLKQKDHEAVVSRQEQVQHLNHQSQELERMSLRTHSLQSKLSAADSEKSILEIRIKQKDVQIQSLQESFGKVKQAATEVMEQLHRGTETSRVLTLPCSRVLLDLMRSSSSINYNDYVTTFMAQNQLDVSGNQRIKRNPTSARNGNDAEFNSNALFTKKIIDSALSIQKPSSQEVYPTKETVGMPLARSESSPKEITSTRETVSMKDPENMRATSPSPLTLAAVAAHNQKLGAMQKTSHHTSVHSWDGAKQQKREQSDCSPPYYSDTESMPVHHKPGLKHYRLRQWFMEVESEKQQATDSEQESLKDVSQNSDLESKTPLDKSDVSETETVPTLSEVPISQVKTVSDLETGSMHSLSEVPISDETESKESVKDSKSSAEEDKTRCSVSEYFRKYRDSEASLTPSATTLYTSSPPASPGKRKVEERVPTADTELKEKKGSPLPSPNSSSLTCSASNLTQRDYFHGTELDISMSTIPEDGQSTVTGVSMSTVRSTLDDGRFTENLNTLDSTIAMTTERLQQLKKKFS